MTRAKSALRKLWSAKTRIGRIPGLHKVFRWATTQFGEGRVYKFRFGLLKGMRWRRYNNTTYWYHLGLWEPAVSQLIIEHLRPGDTFWDVGANAGYHVLLGAWVAGPNGRVFAFEPNPQCVDIIADQLELNSVTTCEIVDVALTDQEGVVTLRSAPNCLMSTLDGIITEGTPIDVRATTINAMYREHGPPDLIKMDIEGAEKWALPGGEELFSGPDKPRLLLSVHGDEVAEFCREFLRDRGYSMREVSGFEQMIVAVPQQREPRS